jgi:cytochrome c biogenesis protein CcmG/thiol:disulfide interchange protein DsbE
MNGRAYGGVPRWSLIAASLVLSGLVVSIVVSPTTDVTAAPFLRPPPSTAGTDLQGGHVSLGSRRGAPLVVIFFASWCGPCHQDAPVYADLADRFRQRVSFISVAVDDPPHEVRGFAKRYGWTWPVVRDDEHRWVAAFGPLGVPATYVIDPEGVVIRTLTGAVTAQQIDASLDPLVLPSG